MRPEKIKQYIDEISELENNQNNKIVDYKYTEAAEIFDEDELKILVIYSTIINSMNSGNNTEIMDISANILNELKKSGIDEDMSSSFINSIFNFNNVYLPLYDLLDLATNGKFDGKPMTTEYRNGVIDSIIVLRKYQRYSGFGDHQWHVDYNTAIDKVINKSIDTTHQH